MKPDEGVFDELGLSPLAGGLGELGLDLAIYYIRILGSALTSNSLQWQYKCAQLIPSLTLNPMSVHSNRN